MRSIGSSHVAILGNDCHETTIGYVVIGKKLQVVVVWPSLRGYYR